MPLLFYYLDEDDNQRGPLTADEVRELIRAGVIGPLTRFRSERMDRWGYAFNIKGMFPDYDPHQPKKPAARPRRWGYRAAVGLLKNPVAIFAIVVACGMLVQAYRSLAVPWLFPPNVMPSPIASAEDEEALNRGRVSPGPSPGGAEDATGGGNLFGGAPSDTEGSGPSGNLFAGGEPAEPRRVTARKRAVPDGNSLPGEVHRGLMGELWCLKPDRMFPLPAEFPDGKFYFRTHDDSVVFSASDPEVDLSPNPYHLSAVMLRQFSDSEVDYPVCNLTGYGQTNSQLSTFVGPLDGMLVAGSTFDWRKLAPVDLRLNIERKTGLRIVDRSGPLGRFPMIASAGEYNDQQIACADVFCSHPTGDELVDFATSVIRLRVFSWPGGRLLAKQESLPLNLQIKMDKHAASVIQQLAFSPDGEYLATLNSLGRIVVYQASSLKRLFAVEGVTMAGPFIKGGRSQQLAFSSHRLSFAPYDDVLLATDRGRLTLIDVRTEQVRRIELPCRVDACCFEGARVMVASTETGEVYEIDVEQEKVVAKALLAGLGRLCTQLNFSVHGQCLSAIFDEGQLVKPTSSELGDLRPVRYAMFWDLRFLRNPDAQMSNNQVWSCVPEFRDAYPGKKGAFVDIHMGANAQKEPETLVVIIHAGGGELHLYPLRALTREAQEQAILLHSLVEPPSRDRMLDPHRTLTYEPPEVFFEQP